MRQPAATCSPKSFHLYPHTQPPPQPPPQCPTMQCASFCDPSPLQTKTKSCPPPTPPQRRMNQLTQLFMNQISKLFFWVLHDWIHLRSHLPEHEQLYLVENFLLLQAPKNGPIQINQLCCVYSTWPTAKQVIAPAPTRESSPPLKVFMVRVIMTCFEPRKKLNNFDLNFLDQPLKE